MTSIKRAFKEAFADNILGLAINFPVQYAIIALCLSFGLGAFWTTVICSGVIFVVALIRKVWIRLHFEKRYLKKSVDTP